MRFKKIGIDLLETEINRKFFCQKCAYLLEDANLAKLNEANEVKPVINHLHYLQFNSIYKYCPECKVFYLITEDKNEDNK